MNKIVRHYPVDQLPGNLRADLGTASTVKLTMEPELMPKNDDFRHRRDRLMAAIADARSSVTGPGVTAREAVERVRALRDEWDH